jgi:FlaG/FlaF family flagellin (archaellin)
MRGPFGVADRAVSQEGMAALGFGLTVLMIGVAGGLLMQSGDSLQDGGPILSTTSESVHATGPDSGWVRISHESGDTVDVADVDVVVRLPANDKRATLHGLPTRRLTQDDYTGNHIFTRGRPGIDGAVAVPNGSGATLEAGDEIAFRIEQRRVDLEPRGTVVVTLRHTESETRLARERIDIVE